MFILLKEIIMSTVESILQNGSHEKSFLQYPKCTVCGAYLVASDDCGYIKSDFLFEPCECIKSGALLGTYQNSKTKIVDKKGNEVKVAIKAKHVLKLLSQEISTPGSFTTDNSEVKKDSDMVNLIDPNIHDAESAFLHFEANFSDKPLGLIIKQRDERKEKERKLENELFAEEEGYNVNFKDSSALNTAVKKPTFKKFGIRPAPAPVPAPLKPTPIAKPTKLTPLIPPVGPTPPPPPPGPTAGPTTGPTSGPSAGGSGGSGTTPPSSPKSTSGTTPPSSPKSGGAGGSVTSPVPEVTATDKQHKKIIEQVQVALKAIETQNNASKDTVKEVKGLITEILAIDDKADVGDIKAKLKEVDDSQGELSKLISTAGTKIRNYSRANAKVKTKTKNANEAKNAVNGAKKLSDEAKQYADEAKQLAEDKKSEVEKVKKEAEEKAKEEAEKAKKEAEEKAAEAKNVDDLRKEGSELLKDSGELIDQINPQLPLMSSKHGIIEQLSKSIGEDDYTNKVGEVKGKIENVKSSFEEHEEKFKKIGLKLYAATDKDTILEANAEAKDLKDELETTNNNITNLLQELDDIKKEGLEKKKAKETEAEKIKNLKDEASTLLGESKTIIDEVESKLVDVDAKFNTIKTLSDDINEQDFTTKVDVVKGKIDSAKNEFEENKTKFADANEKLKDASDETEANDAKDLAEELKGELETTKETVSKDIIKELDEITTEGNGKASEQAKKKAEDEEAKKKKEKEEADEKLKDKKKEVTDKLKEDVEKLEKQRKDDVLPVLEEIKNNEKGISDKVEKVQKMREETTDKIKEYKKLINEANDKVKTVNEISAVDENNNKIPDVEQLPESSRLKTTEKGLDVLKQRFDVETVETTIKGLIEKLEESQESKDRLANLYKEIDDSDSVERINAIDNIEPYLEDYKSKYADKKVAEDVKASFGELTQKLDQSLADIKGESEGSFKDNFDVVKKYIDDKEKEVIEVDKKKKESLKAAEKKKQEALDAKKKKEEELDKQIKSFRVPKSNFYGSNSKTSLNVKDMNVNMRGKFMALTWYDDSEEDKYDDDGNEVVKYVSTGYFQEDVVNGNYDLPTRKVVYAGSPYNYVYKYDPISEFILTNDRLDLVLEEVKNEVMLDSSDRSNCAKFDEKFKTDSKLSNYAKLIYYNSARLNISDADLVAIAKVYDSSVTDKINAIITMVRVVITHKPVFEESLVQYEKEYSALSGNAKYIVSSISMSAIGSRPNSLNDENLKNVPIMDGAQFTANLETERTENDEFTGWDLNDHTKEEQTEMAKILDGKDAMKDINFYSMLVHAKRLAESTVAATGGDEYDLLTDEVKLRAVLKEVISKHRKLSDAEEVRINSLESNKSLIVEIGFNWFWRWNSGYDHLKFDAWESQVIASVVNNLSQQNNSPPPSPKASNNSPPPSSNNSPPQNSPPPSPKAANNTPPPQSDNTQQQQGGPQLAETSDKAPQNPFGKYEDLSYNQLKLLAMSNANDGAGDMPFKKNLGTAGSKAERKRLIKMITPYSKERRQVYYDDLQELKGDLPAVLTTVREAEGEEPTWQPVFEDDDWTFVSIVNLGNFTNGDDEATGILKTTIESFGVDLSEVDEDDQTNPYKLLSPWAEFFVASYKS